MDKKRAAFDIWKAIFQDDEAFMQLFFSTLYHDQNTLLVQNAAIGTANAHLQFLPYNLCVNDRLYRSYYVCGVATRPEMRSRGLAKQLLRAAHYQMWLNGATFSFLIPQENWLYEYYNRVAQYLPLGERAQCLTVDEKSFSQSLTSDSYKRFSAFRQRALSVPHVVPDYLQWRIALQTAVMSSGGYLFYTAQQMDALFERLGDSFIAPAPATNREKNVYRCGMIRLINPIKLLMAYAKEHIQDSWSFFLSDESLPMNNGLYILKSGMVRFFRPTIKDASKYSIPEAFQQEIKKEWKSISKKTPRPKIFTPESLLLFLIGEKRFFFDQLMDGLSF